MHMKKHHKKAYGFLTSSPSENDISNSISLIFPGIIPVGSAYSTMFSFTGRFYIC